ncbi:Aldehyde/histidinol dehydrogenase [Tribonema minus]|uniref:Aldehyde/histidinol dehydrogenase n=1 Tax=Tribonema minus TaxID=303371 RepID=A0A836CEF4_9STRA|nr:Aldehyde/histidinol dehydrogenase [Tribonema minus]
MASTPVTEIPKIIEKLRSNFQAGFTHSLSFRKGQLLQILKLVDENREALEAALFADLHRPKYETAINELDDVKHQAHYTLSTSEGRTWPACAHYTLSTSEGRTRPACVNYTLSTFEGRTWLACVNYTVSTSEGRTRPACVNYTLSTFEARTRPASVHTPLQLRPYGSWSVVPEPYGVVLIIAPWNFPFGLLMNPLVGAIAAGNAAVLKPSEVSSTVAKLLGELVPKYLDSRAYRIVLGAVPETTALSNHAAALSCLPAGTTALLEQRFDKICYTGGGGVGRVVAAAAAKHLTPTLLELGGIVVSGVERVVAAAAAAKHLTPTLLELEGKCPVYVHRSANVRVAARRIMWGKFMNCGQICIAPDYVMADREIVPKLLEEIKATLLEYFSEDPQTSDSYCRIISKSHVDRVAAFLKEEHGGKVIVGGKVDRDDRYLAPTVVLDPNPESSMLRDEIFGPVLPLLSIDGGIEEAVSRVNGGDTPLAAYVFVEDGKVERRWRDGVYAGGMCINEVAAHYSNVESPFGGKGESGMGAYRGAYSFEAFTHKKTVLKTYAFMDFIMPMRYAPYSDTKLALFRTLLLADLTWLSLLFKTAVAAAVLTILSAYIDVKISLKQ